MTHYHPYHLVDPSPWPLVGSVGALGMTAGGVMYFHNYANGEILLVSSLVLVILVMIVWWSDVISEATYMGYHTNIVQNGLSIGMIWFIISEVFFFVSFFWAFYHSALVPTVEVGSIWPPVGIQSISAFDVPLLNTAILLSSGATITWSHHAMISGESNETIVGLIVTIVLGVIFTGLQAMEYYEAPFTIADSVYGSTFYVATGFHGLHVLIGTTFLIVSLVSIIDHQLTNHHHNGYEASIWYWHFVDVIWVYLYVSIYWWGGA